MKMALSAQALRVIGCLLEKQVTTLLLRGPQTPGELRSRGQRMHEFSDMAEVEAALEHLATREDGPFVARLPREPGKREQRYMQRSQHIHRIMANYMPHNQRSGGLLARLGFEKEGYAKDYLLIDGQWRDHVLTALTTREWSAGR